MDAAQGVDELHIKVQVKRSNKKKKSSQEEEEGSDEDIADDQPDVPDETVHEFIMRVGLYVAVHLSRAPDARRDHYKDTLVYQSRKDLITEFLKGTLLTKCQNADCSRSVSGNSEFVHS